MSAPPPWMVQVPALSDWLPARAGLPTSAQLQPLGQLGGGGGGAVLTLTVSTVTVLSAAELWEVTARPCKMAPLTLKLTVEPGTAVQRSEERRVGEEGRLEGGGEEWKAGW